MERALSTVRPTPSFFLDHYGFSAVFCVIAPYFIPIIYNRNLMFWICHHCLCPTFLKPFPFLHRAPSPSNSTPCPTLRHYVGWGRLPSAADPYIWIQAPFTTIKATLSCLPSPEIPLRNCKNKGWDPGSAEVNGNIATDFNKARTGLSTEL